MLPSGLYDDIVGPDRVVQPPLIPGGRGVSLHEVFAMMARGMTSREMRNLRQDILPSTISAVHAFLAAASPDYFAAPRSENPFKSYKVLVDENLPPSIKPTLSSFARVYHVGDVGLSGRPDQAVWEWAVNNSIDMILTRDRKNKHDDDLAMVAVVETKAIIARMEEDEAINISLTDLPLLVRLSGRSNAAREVEKLTTRFKNDLLSYLDSRSTPFVDVLGDRIECGRTFAEILAQYRMETAGVPYRFTIESRDAYKQQIWNTLITIHGVEWLQNLEPQRREYLDERINKAAALKFDTRRAPSFAERLGIYKRIKSAQADSSASPDQDPAASRHPHHALIM
jgi:predicted nuclease of predicted toxin-antitoxin system